MDRLKNEPVLLVAVAIAIVNLAVGLGYLSETDGQQVATILESVIVFALGLLARSNVTPTHKSGL